MKIDIDTPEWCKHELMFIRRMEFDKDQSCPRLFQCQKCKCIARFYDI